MKVTKRISSRMMIYVALSEVEQVKNRLTEARIGFRVQYGRRAAIFRPLNDAEHRLLIALLGEEHDMAKIILAAVSSHDLVRIYEIEEETAEERVFVSVSPIGGSGNYGPGGVNYSFPYKLGQYGAHDSIGLWFTVDKFLNLLKKEPRENVEQCRFYIVYDTDTGKMSVCLPHAKRFIYNSPRFGFPERIWTGVWGFDLMDMSSPIEDIKRLAKEQAEMIERVNKKLVSTIKDDKAVYLLGLDEHDERIYGPACVYCPAENISYHIRYYRAGDPVICLSDGTEKSMKEAGYRLVFPPELIDSLDFAVSGDSLLAHANALFTRMPEWIADKEVMSRLDRDAGEIYLHALETINLLRNPDVKPEGCFWPSHAKLERQTKKVEGLVMARMPLNLIEKEISKLKKLDMKAWHAYHLYKGRVKD